MSRARAFVEKAESNNRGTAEYSHALHHSVSPPLARLQPSHRPSPCYPQPEKKNSHNLALLLLKSGPNAAQSPVGGRGGAALGSGDGKWQWEKVKPPKVAESSSSSSSPSSLLKGLGGGIGAVNGAMGNGGAAGAGAGAAGGRESYRWRHTEAVKLLERALAVHREVRGGDASR